MPYSQIEQKRETERRRSNQKRADSRDVGRPEERRYQDACADFRFFCETYFRDKNDSEKNAEVCSV